jgi:hypothetical protein
MRERGQLHLRQSKAARDRRRSLASQFVLNILRTGSCADCGLIDPQLLEFDHLREKRADVARLVHEGYAIRHVAAEVAKCELVCVNCHRLRTARRGSTWRTNLDKLDTLDRPLRRRNLLFVIDYLGRTGCVDCSERNVIVLDFDHVGTKGACVLTLALNEHSLASIEREIANCQVRCANCHRRRTIRAQPDHLRHRLT